MKPIEVVKKNLVSILCGVVALASIVFLVVAALPKFSGVEKQMDARKDKPKEIQQLLATEHTMPTVKENQPPEKLGFFPNAAAIERASKVVEALHVQAQNVMNQAVAINKANRELLVVGTLPKPINETYGYQFRESYVAVLTRGGKPNPAYTKVVNLPDGVLRSAEPPTELEIKKAKEDLWARDYAPNVVLQNGQPQNLREVAADFLKATAKFDDEFRRRRATEFKVYLEPNALGKSLAIANPANPQVIPSATEMWFAQMALWVQQDVCNSIVTLNDSDPAFKDVPTSPVKHLLAVDIQPGPTMYVTRLGANGAPAPAGGEGAPAADPAAGGGKDYVLSPTGRICNPLYDVVQFRLAAVVDADSVKSFIQQLQYGRFISVLEADLKGVDLEQALEEGYGYGKRPVVEVNLRCEALFLRDWTAWVPQPKDKDGNAKPPIQGPMPLEVQRLLGIPQPTTEQLAPPAATPVAMQN
jgi:hypothetical protein